jgi:cytochrome b involved in lipid metabolism
MDPPSPKLSVAKIFSAISGRNTPPGRAANLFTTSPDGASITAQSRSNQHRTTSSSISKRSLPSPKILTMGWLKSTALFSRPDSHEHTSNDNNNDKSKVISLELDSTLAQHLENVTIHSIDNLNQDLLHPFQPISLEDSELPLIPATIVRSAKKDLNRIWIVVDNTVYDCTDFISEHPGGETVIDNFAGQDCSWQFWRFHHLTHMREWGRPLRVGRTVGVKNRFAERPRFVGLRRRDEWW